MKFDYDIFISFAQSDKSGVDIEWSLKFCNLLDNMLNKMNNEKPVIITSADIEARINMFHITREEIYSKSAVFVVILSEDSLNDQDFIDEMNDFSQYLESQSDGKIYKSKRVFKIMSSRVPFRKLPDFLKFETSYNFFETNLLNGKTQIFDLTYDSKKDNIFWSRLVDLSYDIADSIKMMKGDEEMEEEVAKSVIYLASTTPDQEENRDILKRDLKQLGYEVVPDFELPDDSNDFKDIVYDLVCKSRYSIHILGGYYGNYLENSPFSAIESQNKIVTEYVNNKDESKKFERIVWISSDTKIVEQKQRLYIGRMKRDRTINKSEIIECPLEDIKSIIDSKIVNRENDVRNNQNQIIFFQYPDSENEEVIMISDILNKSDSEIVTSSMLEQNNILQIYWDKLLEADVLLFYNNGNKFWLDFKIKDALKVRGYKKTEKELKIVIISEDENIPVYNGIQKFNIIKPLDIKSKLMEVVS